MLTHKVNGFIFSWCCAPGRRSEQIEPFPCTLTPVLNTGQWRPAPWLAGKRLPSIILSAEEETCTHLTRGGIARSRSVRTSKNKSVLLSGGLTLNTSGVSWHSVYLTRKAIPAQTKSSSPSRTSQRI